MPDQSFGREYRLLTPADFGNVFKNQPRRFSDGYFTILAIPNGRDIGRLGLAVARKHVRDAAGRNRLKRLARETFRKNRVALAGLDAVVLARPGISKAPNAALGRSLETLWHRISAIPR